jgi:hypothetical protein
VEPILVPAPPKSAFNKNRPVSDLLAGQLKHFQHVEHKHGIAIDRASSSDLHTEAGAASYILKMTQAIRSQARSKSSKIAIVPSGAKRSKPVSRSDRKQTRTDGLSLAAASQPSSSPAPSKTTMMGKKKKKKSEQRKKS